MNDQIIIAKSQGHTNQHRTSYGLRNHGIRKFDASSSEVRFWEFDVFGGLAEGVVIFNGKNIFYQYDYQGTYVTDMWEYVSDSLYNFKVGIYKEDKWDSVFLSTRFSLKTDNQTSLNRFIELILNRRPPLFPINRRIH